MPLQPPSQLLPLLQNQQQAEFAIPNPLASVFDQITSKIGPAFVEREKMRREATNSAVKFLLENFRPATMDEDKNGTGQRGTDIISSLGGRTNGLNITGNFISKNNYADAARIMNALAALSRSGKPGETVTTGEGVGDVLQGMGLPGVGEALNPEAKFGKGETEGSGGTGKSLSPDRLISQSMDDAFQRLTAETKGRLDPRDPLFNDPQTIDTFLNAEFKASLVAKGMDEAKASDVVTKFGKERKKVVGILTNNLGKAEQSLLKYPAKDRAAIAEQFIQKIMDAEENGEKPFSRYSTLIQNRLRQAARLK